MKKLNKRSLFSAVLALMLVFTVGFYSSAEPTTAWFTAFGDSAKDFTMDNIEIAYSGDTENTVELKFDASTKFADADERSKMFEHACKFFTVTIENTGERDALVFIDIAEESKAVTTDKGVRYYIYEYDENAIKTYKSAVEIVPGVFENADGERVIERETKTAEEDKYFRTEKMIAEILDEKIGDRTLSAEEQAAFFDAGSSNLVELKAGEIKNFCCAFWVEHDYFETIQPVDGIRTLECNVDVLINAVQADYYTVETTTAA